MSFPCFRLSFSERSLTGSPAEIFAAQAVEAERGMERLYEIHGKEIADGYAVCHGEPDYHHILIGNGYTAVTEFNQMHLGVQMEDPLRYVCVA